MGNNRLENLDINGLEAASAELGIINTYAFNRIHSITLINDFERESSGRHLCQSDLEIIVGYETNNQERLVRIMFHHVAQLQFPDSPQFDEFEVTDVSNSQLEGIRYEAVNHGQNSFHCLCRSMDIQCV